MKNLILIATLLMASVQVFAKMSVYSNKHAMKLVLNDDATMAKINKGELKSVEVVRSTGLDFVVRLTQTRATPIGTQLCFTDVNVATIMKLVTIRPGSPGISTSQLVIRNVNGAICSK